MIYFTLPSFYFNFNIINKVMSLDKKYYKFPVAFEAATGNFPYCYFNGGYNNNQGLGALYNDFIQCGEQLNIPLCFNLSNIFIEDIDFDNTQMNLILSLNETGSNMIEFSSFPLYLYLKEKYPNYIYIFSKQAFTLCPNITPEQIDNLILKNGVDYVSLDEKYSTDLNFIKQIKTKEKIKIAVTSECDNLCSQFYNCRIQQHQAQYNFSNFNQFYNCSHYLPYHKRKPILSLEEIKEKYKNLGFSHFTLGETIYDEKEDNFILFFIEYFIKQEYKYEVLKIMMLEDSL